MGAVVFSSWKSLSASVSMSVSPRRMVNGLPRARARVRSRQKRVHQIRFRRRLSFSGMVCLLRITSLAGNNQMRGLHLAPSVHPRALSHRYSHLRPMEGVIVKVIRQLDKLMV